MSACMGRNTVIYDYVLMSELVITDIGNNYPELVDHGNTTVTRHALKV